MDCKTTFTKRRPRRSGFTLTELLVAVGVGSVILAALAGLTFYTGRSFAAIANYVELDSFSRNALDTMSKEIRQTRRLKTFSETQLVFEDFDGSDVSYTYSSDQRILFRSRNNVPDGRPLLKDCNFLQFSIFQRNPIAGSYNQYATATAATCKLVQLRWVCSRDLIKAKCNTESVQSAKIVIRKQ
jgi:prepilin-type N-terminal cleavage/methylation domain-containing protein